TSRYPLVDLQDWEKRGYRDTRLDDLAPEAAVAVLRGWGVVGEEAALRAAAAQVGHHALSVAVLGSYLRSFAGGRIEAVKDFGLAAWSSSTAAARPSPGRRTPSCATASASCSAARPSASSTLWPSPLAQAWRSVLTRSRRSRTSSTATSA